MILNRLRILAAGLLLVVIPSSARVPRAWLALEPLVRSAHIPRSLTDASLRPERRASVSWETRSGPERTVADAVCLVPDLHALLRVIAGWDQRQFFPVLIDQPELVLKFVRAFRPQWIVRYPGGPEPLAEEQLWPGAVEGVGRAWVGTEPVPNAERVPDRFGPTPPGIVVSSPRSPSLAGAIALAAGRYQPLLRWDPPARFSDIPSQKEAERLARDLEARIADRIPDYDGLGDDCDFLTLAADYPYRYETPLGPNVFDDLLGRSESTGKRRAYTGRLVGSSAQTVYMAMCSLFLQPRSAALFDTFTGKGGAWEVYTMRPAAARLRARFSVTYRAGAQANLAGWHRLFDPWNPFELVMINSSGMPENFTVSKGAGQRSDIPWTVPAIVLQIHSHSASDPADPDSLAGRWLANGAYIYFGAVNEPYLFAFRTPELLAEELASRLPISVAVRQSTAEPFGSPWRLIFLGDPLFSLKASAARKPRAARLPAALAGWPSLEGRPAPSAQAADELKLDWAYEATLAECRAGSDTEHAEERLQTLLSIRRQRLSQGRLELFDGLLADFLDQPRFAALAQRRLAQIPHGAQSPLLRRRLETARTVELQQAIAARDFDSAARAWSEIMAADPPRTLATMATARTAALVDNPIRLRLWRDQLRVALQNLRAQPVAFTIEQELKRIEERLGL